MRRVPNPKSIWNNFRRSIVIVHKEILPIDRTYVIYEWCDDIINSLRSFGLIVLGGALFQNALKTSVNSWSLAIPVIAAFVVYTMATRMSSSWSSERGQIFNVLLGTRLETRKAEHLSTLDLGRMVDPAFKELSHMFDRRGMSSIDNLWHAQRQMVTSATGLIVASTVILNMDPVLGLIGVCFSLPTVFSSWFNEKMRRTVDEREIFTRRQRDEINDAVTDSHHGITARLLSLTKPFMLYYKELTGILLNNVRFVARYRRRWRMWVNLFQVACLCLFLLHFADGLIAGKYTLVRIAAIFGSMQLLSSGIGGFGNAISRIDHLHRDYGYLVQFFETKPLVDESQCKDVQFRSTPTILVKNVSFTYPGSGDPALTDCSVRVEPGEKVALVGPNGCGKTTLLRLLARVYLPSAGSIYANDLSLTEIRQNAWLGNAAMIVQDGNLAGVELARALTGKSLAELTPEELERLTKAVELTGAKSLVEEDPRGFGVWNGPQWPQGRGFSTGQEQRLMLAAGMYRALAKHTHAIMLDEPTANCDATMKTQFYSSLTSAPEMQRLTVFVSLHDPLYLHFFTRVLQFEKGKLVNDLRTPEQIERYKHEIAISLASDL